MNAMLTWRAPIRVAALLAVTMLIVAMLAVAVAYSISARHAVADDGVIHGYGIQGSGAVHPNDNGFIHGF